MMYTCTERWYTDIKCCTCRFDPSICEVHKMITVTASWIFNRLCDEPERLRVEFSSTLRELHRNGPLSFEHFQGLQSKYENILAIDAQVAELRLQNHPNIEVVHDTSYIEVKVK